MNPETLDIKEFPTRKEAEEAGYTITLTRRQAATLSEKNRAQRRVWLKSKGYFPPEEHNRWQANRSAKARSRKRVKAATLKMQIKARRLAKA